MLTSNIWSNTCVKIFIHQVQVEFSWLGLNIKWASLPTPSKEGHDKGFSKRQQGFLSWKDNARMLDIDIHDKWSWQFFVGCCPRLEATLDTLSPSKGLLYVDACSNKQICLCLFVRVCVCVCLFGCLTVWLFVVFCSVLFCVGSLLSCLFACWLCLCFDVGN